MNPNNYLLSHSIFPFLDLKYGDGDYSIDNVKLMLKDTYFEEKDLEGFAKWFYDAGVSSGVNPYFLVSKSIVETGAGNKKHYDNPLLVGYQFDDGTVVYNFFGIGATDGDATVNGANRAKEEGWTTPKLAIEGGAKFAGESYVLIGQDTYYTMRYNIPGYLKGKGWSHQYATSITDAYTKGNSFANRIGYSLTEEERLFKIPVFR